MDDASTDITVCTTPGKCPVCARPSGCRLDSGEAYKGPCWCEEPILPAAALRRLLEELPEPRCLCRVCLETLARRPDISWSELARPQAPAS